MKRILVIYEQKDNTVDLNISGIKETFHKEILEFCLSKKVRTRDLQRCDICIAIRPNSIYTVRIADAVLKSKRVFVTTFDDDLLNLPKGHSSRWRGKYARECLLKSQYVLCCNPSLLNFYKGIAPAPKYVLTTAHIHEEDILPVLDEGEQIRIVYPAGKDHVDLFDAYVKSVIDDLYEKYEGRCAFYLIGIDPDVSNLRHKECVHVESSMPLETYNKYMRDNRYDLGIAPLHDTSFCNKKYFNKYIEYSKLGIAGLYSNCLPYTYVVKDQINGLLVGNTQDEWYRALDYAIGHVHEMKAIARRAQEHIREEFTLEHARHRIYQELDMVLTSEASKGDVVYKKNPFKAFTFEMFSTYYRLKAHLKSEGIVGTKNRIISRFTKS